MKSENNSKHLPYHDKVFTIADESCYLLIFGVPSLNLDQPVKERCRHYGNIDSVVKIIDYPDKELFTDVFLVKYNNLRAARYAKRSLDDSSFYGGSLHVCYAPEYETVAECRLKLYECRQLNARISRKAEHEYFNKFSTNRQTSKSNSSVIHSPSASPILTSSDLTESVKFEKLTSEKVSFLPVSQDTMIHSNERVTYPSYDALDDSRLYWKRLGATFLSDEQISCNSRNVSSCPPPVATTINHPPTSKPCDLSLGQKRPIPLPVLQALSCRPYLENVSKLTTSSSSLNETFTKTNKTSKHYPSDSFIPRVIATKAYKKKYSLNPKAPLHVSDSVAPISVGELKRLACSLGPEQGPSLPSPQNRKIITESKRSLDFESY
ncbi:RNA-binding protein 48 [Schistosoma japonicum]|nr:RNA-binding protein 48 [Schistosoma japonicum]